MPKRASTENGEAGAAEAAAKKAKPEAETVATDFSCDLKTTNGLDHNLKISAWNVAGEGGYMPVYAKSERKFETDGLTQRFKCRCLVAT